MLDKEGLSSGTEAEHSRGGRAEGGGELAV